jgi:hypothetical protein
VKSRERNLITRLLKALEILVTAVGEALIEKEIHPSSALTKAHAQAFAILIKARVKRRSRLE